MFLDQCRIYVKAGDGGRGCVSFLREPFKPFGGPDGGRGGKGGDVILEGCSHLNTLAKIARKVHYKAKNGQPGMGKNRYGKKGQDLIIQVPVGTIVRDEATHEVLGDITQIGQQLVVARGGRGGRGNKDFATPTHQVPREYEEGGEGEERWLILELKLLAQVGLVGFPNAGKSTFLSRITKANPKVAPYPFTTMNPHLGTYEFEDYSRLVIADIPGLIEGAHKGHGLGTSFLKHIERTSVILHLIDSSEEDIIGRYHTIRKELESFSPSLAEKEEVLCLTKKDLASDVDKVALEKELGKPVFYISAVTGEGLSSLLYALKKKVEEVESEEMEKGKT